MLAAACLIFHASVEKKSGLTKEQRSSRLNAKQWRKLRNRRALHVLVIALNYIHGGCEPTSLASLRRQPSSIHLAIYDRLRALLVACDRPDSLSMQPGRSGAEFIARMTELERFVDEAQLDVDLYARSQSQVEKVGEIGASHHFKTEEKYSPVEPYRDLDAGRLKLTGTGEWSMDEYLEDILWLPYLEPAILLHGKPVSWTGPNFSRESKEENLALAKLWDSKGLLAIFPDSHPNDLRSRVFNTFKNQDVDRQIGDRRWMNGAERHISGPSAFLPAGYQLTSMHCPTSCRLIACATDRKDFYHQAKVSRERAISNLLPFDYEASAFSDSPAFQDMAAELSAPYDREKDGDRYGMKPRSILQAKDVKRVYVGFKSLYQGDHLGVEYALSSHFEVLRQRGLFQSGSTIMRRRPFPEGPLWQGLVIDDFFAVSREPVANDVSAARSVERLEVAEETYAEEKMIGSDDKTVRGSDAFKIVGAEVLSDKKARDVGVVLVGAPASKRIPMVALSLEVAKMPAVSRSLASRLAGNWVSILMYRRPFSCLLGSIFRLGNTTEKEAKDVVLLPRKAAEELVLASIFGLIAVTDISVEYDDVIYATDASMGAGAFTKKKVGSRLSSVLWRGGDRKGAYTMLDNPARCQLRSLGVDTDALLVAEDFHGPTKSLKFEFDAVEICGGSGVLSKALADEGLVVCPPIDLSASKHYDLENTKLVEWIFQMISEKRFRAVICEPVCRTFSPAQHPASRSYSCPLGFNRKDRKTYVGNFIAFRCLAILWMAWRHSVLSLLEQPQLSKMAWLPFWKYLLEIGFEEAVINSCAFGCIHKKPFRFLGWGINMRTLATKCPGGHKHVRIEGKYTKASAIYHPGLAKFLASHIASALRATLEDEERAPRLESVVCNDLLQQGRWTVGGSWRWKKPAHINVLESRALVGLLHRLLQEGGDRRFFAMLDSRVAKGAHAKGRSSALTLRRSLLCACAYIISGNLRPSYGFAPTRLNTADAPTRDRPLPSPSDHSILDFLSFSQIADLHSHQFSRASAGWIRLYILAVMCFCPGEGGWTFASPSHHIFPASSVPWISIIFGICLILPAVWSVCQWSSFLCAPLGNLVGWLPQNGNSVHFIALLIQSSIAEAMPLTPQGSEENRRAARRAGNTLQADRVILQSTRDRRSCLLADFDIWLATNFRTTLHALIGQEAVDAEAVADALVAYGKQMYDAGKSYGRFSETINAVTARRPALRRNLASAWDLAFNWVVDEPREHHTALPVSILLAAVTLALLWGWTREAASIALAWVGVLRIGEVLAALRSDLILPQDAAPGFECAILKIRLPKTRGRAARHQSARIDPEDVVSLLVSVFGRLSPSEPLWPWSPSALRKKFGTLLTALGLADAQGKLPYGLSSLRPGGATFWLQITEDAEFVRRKGRWLSTRVLEVYLQESSVATYQTRMTSRAKSRVEDLCSLYPSVLSRAIFLKQVQTPESIWPRQWLNDAMREREDYDEDLQALHKLMERATKEHCCWCRIDLKLRLQKLEAQSQDVLKNDEQEQCMALATTICHIRSCRAAAHWNSLDESGRLSQDAADLRRDVEDLRPCRGRCATDVMWRSAAWRGVRCVRSKAFSRSRQGAAQGKK
eukprot:Skav216351  [mRNA]  locus=scaffold2385:191031:215658:- [translate_table: standard]